MIMPEAELIAIMRTNMDPQYQGVVRLPDVENDLIQRKVNVAETLLTFCQNTKAENFLIYSAACLLKSLLMRGKLSESQAGKLLDIAEHEHHYFGFCADGECYKVMYEMIHQPYAAPVLTAFIQKLFQEKSRDDWRWIGYCALSSLLGKGIRFQLPRKLAEEIVREAGNEKDPGRRDQLLIISGQLIENQKLFSQP